MSGTLTNGYHPVFCKDNVYWLCSELDRISADNSSDWFAVFISNPSQHVVLSGMIYTFRPTTTAAGWQPC